MRTPLESPWAPQSGLSWQRIPLPEPSPSLGEDRLREWIREWVRGWSLWLEGEVPVVEELRPTVIISDMAPQPLLLARKMGVPGWFLGHFNWFSYLSQFMEVSGLLDEVALAYEAAHVAFVPPFSWGQGIFTLVQEVPLVGGEPEIDRVKGARREALARGIPVFVDEGVDGVTRGLREVWGEVVVLRDLEDLPAAQIAYLRPSYHSLVLGLRGEVPCVLFHGGREPERAMAREMEGLGVAMAREGDVISPSPEETAQLINTAYEAYRALPSLYRLEGSQFLVETLARLGP